MSVHDAALLVARLVVTGGLLQFAYEARPEAPEIAGGIVFGVIAHWLPRAAEAVVRAREGPSASA